MSDPKAFAQRLEEMDEEDRDHFRSVIEKLSHCYAKNSAQAVIIYSHMQIPITEALTINCNDIDSYEMVRGALNYFEFLNTKDAPPKEQLN
jgi:hypothetical protein